MTAVPLKRGYDEFKSVKALALAAIALSVLLADCLTGFKRIDTFGRWACVVFAILGSGSTACYWRALRRNRARPSDSHRHGNAEPEYTHRNPPAKLPPKRES